VTRSPDVAATASVILAVLDEGEHIDAVLESISGQDHGSLLEIIVADGGSTDDTRTRVGAWTKRDPRVMLIDNPQRKQSFGLNAAAAAATGDYLVRADGHTVYEPDYVRRSVELAIETGGAVGGPMNAVGSTGFERAVAAVMKTRWLMPARFHHAVTRERVDTVYLGAFRRDDFLSVGGFRSFPSGAGEDPDFYYRWRSSGREVYVDPSIKSRYAPRSSISALWSQYTRYGRAKAEMLLVNGQLPSLRPLAPVVLVCGLAAGVVGGIVWRSALPPAVVTGIWLGFLAVVAVSRRRGLRFVAVAAVMQVAYGVGALSGLARPGSVRSLKDPVAAG
jgi:glycosyltransferase involved in cell wall biosynthesis